MDGCQTGAKISKRLLSTSIDPDGESVHLLKPGLSQLAPEASFDARIVHIRIYWKHLKKQRPALAGLVRC